MWHKGTIGVPGEKGKMVVCHYWVKAYEEGSVYGIEKGRISKLTIKINGTQTCNYDRGWDIEPEDDITKVALAILIKEYN